MATSKYDAIENVTDDELLMLRYQSTSTICLFIRIAKSADHDLNTSFLINNDLWEIDTVVANEINRRNLSPEDIDRFSVLARGISRAEIEKVFKNA